MGLDLYHFKANADRRGKPFVIEVFKGWDALLAKLSWCLVTLYKEDEHFAYVGKYGFTSTPVAPELFATLATYGIETDYTEISPLPLGTASVGRLFKLRSDEEGWLPMLILLDDMGRIGLPTLYVEEIGHQQNRVAREFYDEFESGEHVCAMERVRRIRDLTDADERLDFEERFLDTWSERESFVFVSY
jgi:hypothetical protein